MRNNSLLLCILLLLACAAKAQSPAPSPTFTVKGVLLDSLTKETEPYATIRIVHKALPDKPVKMAVTTANGKFQESFAARPGKYVITFTSVGKSPVVREFELGAEKTIIDFGTLYMAEATTQLKGVEVVAQRPLVKVDLDKIEYNVADDPDSKTDYMLEMLRKVPLVTIDGEDNIQVNGSSSYVIHVNGKPNTMMSKNPKDVLKSMPANTVKTIEVITSPGVKYDAEGVGGILNIVTAGLGFEGYMAAFSGRGGNRGGGGSAYATIKQNKLTLSASYGSNLSWNPTSHSSNSMEYHNSTEQKFLDSETSRKSEGAFQNGRLEASYEIDTLRLITLSGSIYGGGSDSNGWETTGMYDAARAVKAYGYNVHTQGDMSYYSLDGRLDYQRTSKRNKQRMWTLSYQISTRPDKIDNQSEYIYTNLEEVPEHLRRSNLHTDGSTNTIEQTIQFDYTTPIGKYHNIESGVKYIMRDNKSENDYYTTPVGSDQEELDADRTSHYKHLNDILAAYLGYTLRYKKISFRPGLRYEHTMQHVKYLQGRGENFETTFNDVIPAVNFGWKIGKTRTLTASYNMRISRPGIWYLNPYFNDQNPMSVSQGNPDLQSEKSHAFNLGLSSFTPKLNVNLSLRHSFNNNSIEQYSRVLDQEEVISGHLLPAQAMYTTYSNIGKKQDTGLSAYASWTVTRQTRLSLNSSVSYVDMKSPMRNLHNYGWMGTVNANINHTLPWKVKATLSGGGSTSRISLQGKGGGSYNYSMSLNRSFLKDRLTVTAGGYNFLKRDKKFDMTTEGVNFTQRIHSTYPVASYNINVSYHIGQLKATVKKAARSINNDDVKAGGAE